jgi:opacity protein-like surface antigen
MLRRVMITAILLAALAAPHVQASDAQFGVQGSWADDADLGVGARLLWDATGSSDGIGAIASFDYFFPGDDITYWELNGNLTYSLRGSLQPYVGAGLNLAHGEGDSELGLNLLGGLRFSDRVYGEARVEIDGGEQFVLTIGLLI